MATWNGDQGLGRDWAICQGVISFAALTDLRPSAGDSKIAGIVLEEVTSLLSIVEPLFSFPGLLRRRVLRFFQRGLRTKRTLAGQMVVSFAASALPGVRVEGCSIEDAGIEGLIQFNEAGDLSICEFRAETYVVGVNRGPAEFPAGGMDYFTIGTKFRIAVRMCVHHNLFKLEPSGEA